MKKRNLVLKSTKSEERHPEVDTTQAQEERVVEGCKKQIYVLLKFYKKLYSLLEQVFKRRLWGWDPPSENTGLLYLRLCGAIENKLKMLEQDFNYLVKTGRLWLDARFKAINEPDVNIFGDMKRMKWLPFEKIVNVGPVDWQRSGRHTCSAFLEKIRKLWESFKKERKKISSISDTDDLKLLEMVKNTISHYKQVSKERMALLRDEKKSSIRKRIDAPSKFPTPPNTTWKMVSIQFVSDRSVRVMVGLVDKTYTFEEMGFKDNRKVDSPDKQWEVLRCLAKNRGELSKQKGTAIQYGEKRVQGIRKKLRTFMGIEDDPFFPYGRVWCYRTKFSIEDKSCDE